MDYSYLAKMAETASALSDMRKRNSGHIFAKIVVKTNGDRTVEISERDLSSVCVEQVEQALIAEAERYGYRVKNYANGEPDANVLYKN